MKKISSFFLVVIALVAFNSFSEGAQIVSKKSIFSGDVAGFQHAYIAFARNTQTGESLIVWQKTFTENESNSKIYARLVNANGIAVGPEIIIADRTGSGLASVAYNPISNEYAVIYDNSNSGSYESGSSIFAKHLTSRGRPTGQEIVVTNDPVSSKLSNLTGQIVFHPKTGGYALAWLRSAEDLTKDCGLVLTLLTPSLTRVGPIKIIKRIPEEPKFPIPLSIQFLPGSDKLMISFRQIVEGGGASAKVDLFLATLDSLLKNVKPSNVAKINSVPLERGHWHFSLALLPDQSGVVVFRDNDGMKIRSINTQGLLTSGGRFAFNSPKKDAPLTHPLVVFSTNAHGTRGLLLAYENTSEGIKTWAQLLDAKGNPDGTAVQVHATSIGETLAFPVLMAIPVKPTQRLFRFNQYISLNRFSGANEDILSSEILQLKLSVNIP